MPDHSKTKGCKGCREGEALDFDFSMAFQPIIDVQNGSVFAYEALVRGTRGEPASSVLGRVTDGNRYAFDQRCRIEAIQCAVKAGLLSTAAKLSINFLPNAVYSPLACLQLTLVTANAAGLPLDRIIFEFTENEEMVDPDHVADIISCYRDMGFTTAIDDFGAGFSGLSLLARFCPDLIKLDMALIRGIDSDPRRRTIATSLKTMCDDLGVTVVAEGVETHAEAAVLRDIGVRFLQGYVFAKPSFQSLPVLPLKS
jgi:EAL domain-containing protein (putative c-di-GMP-specific phosphodiesterase class I)